MPVDFSDKNELYEYRYAIMELNGRYKCLLDCTKYFLDYYDNNYHREFAEAYLEKIEYYIHEINETLEFVTKIINYILNTERKNDFPSRNIELLQYLSSLINDVDRFCSELETSYYSYGDSNRFGCVKREYAFEMEKISNISLYNDDLLENFKKVNACIENELLPYMNHEDADMVRQKLEAFDQNYESLHDIYNELANKVQKYLESIASSFAECDSISFDGSSHSSEYHQNKDTGKVAIKEVDFSAVAPKNISKGSYSIINVIMYEKDKRYVVNDILSSSDEAMQEQRSGIKKTEKGAEIKIILSSPEIEIEDNTQTNVWNGDYLNFSFSIFLPDDYTKQQIPFKAAAYINDIKAANMNFIVQCTNNTVQKIDVSKNNICNAFVSYASQDRKRVSAIVQGMKTARKDLNVFLDVESLRCGENWKNRIHNEIDKCDILYLCWSHYAKESEWVDEEWRYAYNHKGEEFIEPIPIEMPDVCPPPNELKHKHFNDKILFIINSIKDPFSNFE
ncbi:MAG: toll/interleukin-1 receptor domain-containing protein [Ruminococcus sp.]|nr:toll/interleukin-1 receptor domain-containing protein [Ruminococcus sp.]